MSEMTKEQWCCDCEKWRKTWDHIHAENFKVAIEQCDKTRIELIATIAELRESLKNLHDSMENEIRERGLQLAAKDKRIEELEEWKRKATILVQAIGYVNSDCSANLKLQKELLTQD